MKAEYDALRRVARLALDYFEYAAFSGANSRAATAGELLAALEDLQRRFPYTITPLPGSHRPLVRVDQIQGVGDMAARR